MSFGLQEPHEVFLRFTATAEEASQFAVHLLDEKGNEGSGSFAPEPRRHFGSQKTTWGEFLDRYVRVDAGQDDLCAFGVDLFRECIQRTLLPGGPILKGRGAHERV